jgi:hypothetical protein
MQAVSTETVAVETHDKVRSDQEFNTCLSQ